jgi:hypothetical protein
LEFLYYSASMCDIVERRGDLKEMSTGMELASSAEGTSDIQSIVSICKCHSRQASRIDWSCASLRLGPL